MRLNLAYSMENEVLLRCSLFPTVSQIKPILFLEYHI